MSGNIGQWVQDKYQDSYRGAPVDGSAFEGAGSCRVVRGGSFGSPYDTSLRAGFRNYGLPGTRYFSYGFRLARQ